MPMGACPGRTSSRRLWSACGRAPVLVPSLNSTDAPRMVATLDAAQVPITLISMEKLTEADFQGWLQVMSEEADDGWLTAQARRPPHARSHPIPGRLDICWRLHVVLPSCVQPLVLPHLA